MAEFADQYAALLVLGFIVRLAGAAAMSWAQRLKRLFNIAIQSCEHCGGAVRIIASIEDPGRYQDHPRPA